MKTTPFTDVHIALGAKMHEFAGFNMPIEYTGIIDEHMTVVNGVGVFDVSHMGEFWVKGPNALAFIQSVTSNDASVLPIGKAQYTCFPNDKGGIVDDLLVYHYEPEKYLLVVNAGNIAKDWDWCVSHNTVGAELENSSDRTAQLAIQGPKAVEVLQRLTPVDLSSIPYYSFVTGEFAGCKNVIISNTGYTGAGGFELYFYLDDAMTIWNAIFEAGKPEGIKPIAWVHVTRCVWKWASACMEMTSTTPLRRSKPVWVGSPSSPKARTSPTAPNWNARRKKALPASCVLSNWPTKVFPVTAMKLPMPKTISSVW